MRRLGRLPLGPTLHPSLLGSFLPPIPQSAKGWSPELTRRGSCQGRTFSCKSWSKDLITLSTFDDPLGLLGVNPLQGNVYSCVHKSTASQAHPPPDVLLDHLLYHPAGKGSLCQTALRMSVYSLMDLEYFATAKGNGLASRVLRGRYIQVPWTSHTPFHLIPHWSG